MSEEGGGDGDAAAWHVPVREKFPVEIEGEGFSSPELRRGSRPTMYHTIQFTVQFTADRESSPKDPLERLLILKGTQMRAQLKPYVEDASCGPVEVADLFFEDRTAIRGVPFAYFAFAE